MQSYSPSARRCGLRLFPLTLPAHALRHPLPPSSHEWYVAAAVAEGAMMLYVRHALSAVHGSAAPQFVYLLSRLSPAPAEACPPSSGGKALAAPLAGLGRSEQRVPLESVRAGDVLAVRAGDMVAVDGTVTRGARAAAISRALLLPWFFGLVHSRLSSPSPCVAIFLPHPLSHVVVLLAAPQETPWSTKAP